MPEIVIDLSQGISIAVLLKQAQLCSSTSEAMRMVKQGAVKINGERISDSKLVVTENEALVLQVGKRKFARIKPG